MKIVRDEKISSSNIQEIRRDSFPWIINWGVICAEANGTEQSKMNK